MEPKADISSDASKDLTNIYSSGNAREISMVHCFGGMESFNEQGR